MPSGTVRKAAPEMWLRTGRSNEPSGCCLERRRHHEYPPHQIDPPRQVPENDRRGVVQGFPYLATRIEGAMQHLMVLPENYAESRLVEPLYAQVKARQGETVRVCLSTSRMGIRGPSRGNFAQRCIRGVPMTYMEICSHYPELNCMMWHKPEYGL